MHKKLGIATRFYGFAEKDVQRLSLWIDAALDVVSPENIYIALRTEEDHSASRDFMRTHYPRVNAFSVTPWGK